MIVGSLNYAVSYIDTVSRFLVTGGQDMIMVSHYLRNSADLYDVSTSTVSQLASRMSIPRVWHKSTFIPTINQVLLCGECTSLNMITGKCEVLTNTYVLFNLSTNTYVCVVNRVWWKTSKRKTSKGKIWNINASFF
jgi:hypothetical protein